MIDIVFSESACGSLKMAQHNGKGKTTDIYGFNLVLSVGDISENQLGIKRKKTLEHLYSVYPNDEGSQAAEEIFNKAIKDLETIRERWAAGEALRIWYSNQPDEMCGLYWFMAQLNQWNMHHGHISIVKLPEWEVDENGNIVERNCWGEVAPEAWHQYLALKRSVPLTFLQSCAARWQELQRENTPLRATVNGQLISVSETFYDYFILREIAAEEEEFLEVRVIGKVMGKYQLGIGDAWVALRIEEMISTGKLKPVTAGDKEMPIYHRVLKKCTHSL